LYATPSRTYWSILPASSAKYDPCETQKASLRVKDGAHKRTMGASTARRQVAQSCMYDVQAVCVWRTHSFTDTNVKNLRTHSVSDKYSRFRGWGPAKKHLRFQTLRLLTLQQDVRSCPAVQSARQILPSTASNHYTEYTCSLSCVWYKASGTASRRDKT